MDTSVDLIADYAYRLRFADLPAAAVHHAKRCMVDTFGCALAAFAAEPSRIAREMAERTNIASGARVIGTAHRTLPELAAFANGVMVRYLDANDGFSGGGHPSDAIPAILAIAEMNGADGRAITTAIALAYEISYNLAKTSRMRYKGMDHVLYTGVGGAVGAAKLLGLSRSQIADTISMSITPYIPLAATRYGVLSMWKGCAAANSARNGVFAALLAAAGMTGPEKPIEGNHGLKNLVGEFELLPFPAAGEAFKITEVALKYFPAEACTLSPITATLQLTPQIRAEDIEQVTIYIYKFAWEVVGSEPEKWHPTTREAADHSLPYIIAAVLTDGEFSEDMFSDERLVDDRIRQLIKKIEIKEDPQLTAEYPKKLPCRVEILTKSGKRSVASVDYQRGHNKNPMTDDEVNAKFRRFVSRALPQQQIDQALAALWKLDSATDVGAIFDAVRIAA